MNRNKASIIIPTCNRYEVIRRNIEIMLKQDWHDFEIIVCDDSNRENYEKEGKAFAKEIEDNPKIKYRYVARFDIDGNKDYGLARARNYGVLDAEGEYLIFLDDRISADTDSLVKIFVSRLRDESPKKKLWLFGNKGNGKTSFVENCSAVRRKLLVDAGMFCERIDEYGGMTREIERRLSHQGFTFIYVPEAKAKQIHKSTGWDKKPEQIGRMRALLTKMFD